MPLAQSRYHQPVDSFPVQLPKHDLLLTQTHSRYEHIQVFYLGGNALAIGVLEKLHNSK